MAFKLPNIGKMIKMKYNFNPILQNQLVLYLFLFMTLVQTVIYVNSSDITSIVFMCLLGFVTAFFSKNMIVILCVALVVTNILNTGLNRAGIEGMKEGAGKTDKKSKAPTSNEVASNLAKEDGEKLPTPKEDGEKLPTLKEESKGATSVEKSENSNSEMQQMLTALKEEFPGLQQELTNELKSMDNIINKTESFVEKYENYKTNSKK